MRPVRRIIHWLMTLFTPHRKNLLSISIRYYCQIPISACIKHLLLGVLLGFISFVFSRHFHLSLHGIRVSHFSTATSPSILRNTINDVNLLLVRFLTHQMNFLSIFCYLDWCDDCAAFFRHTGIGNMADLGSPSSRPSYFLCCRWNCAQYAYTSCRNADCCAARCR